VFDPVYFFRSLLKLLGGSDLDPLFTNHILRLFVGSQPKEYRLAQLVIERPLGELNLSAQNGSDPLAPFHDRGRDAQPPSGFSLLWQVDKGASRPLKLLKLRVDARQEFLGKAGPHPAGESKTLWSVVSHQQGTEIFAASFGQCVAADNKFLRQSQLDLDPGAAAPAAFVERVKSLGNEAFEAELLGDPEQILLAARIPSSCC
jgi:hypothetical protein